MIRYIHFRHLVWLIFGFEFVKSDFTCPSGREPMINNFGNPVACLPTQDLCPSNAHCWYNGFDYICCPNGNQNDDPVPITSPESTGFGLIQAPATPEETPSDSIFDPESLLGSWEGAEEALNAYGALSPTEFANTELAEYISEADTKPQGVQEPFSEYYDESDYVDFGNFADLLPPPPPEETLDSITPPPLPFEPEVTKPVVHVTPKPADLILDKEPVTVVATAVAQHLAEELLPEKPSEYRRTHHIGKWNDSTIFEPLRKGVENKGPSLKELLENNAKLLTTPPPVLAEKTSVPAVVFEYDYNDADLPEMKQFPPIIMEIETETAPEFESKSLASQVPSPILLPHAAIEIETVTEQPETLGEKVIAVQGSGYKTSDTKEAFSDKGEAGSLISNSAETIYHLGVGPDGSYIGYPGQKPSPPALQPEAGNLFATEAPSRAPFRETLSRRGNTGTGIIDPPVIVSATDVWFSPKIGVTAARPKTTTEEPKITVPVTRITRKPRTTTENYSGLDIARVLKLAVPVAEFIPRKTEKVTHPRLRPFDRHGQQRIWGTATTARPATVFLNPTMLKMAEHVAKMMKEKKMNEEDSHDSHSDEVSDKKTSVKDDRIALALSKLENILREAYKNVTRTLIKAAKIDSEEEMDTDLFLQTFRSVLGTSDEGKPKSFADNLQSETQISSEFSSEELSSNSAPWRLGDKSSEISVDSAESDVLSESVEKSFVPAIPPDFEQFYQLISESPGYSSSEDEKSVVTKFQPERPAKRIAAEVKDNWFKLPSSAVSVRRRQLRNRNEEQMSVEDVVQMNRILKEKDSSDEKPVTWAPKVTTTPVPPTTTFPPTTKSTTADPTTTTRNPCLRRSRQRSRQSRQRFRRLRCPRTDRIKSRVTTPKPIRVTPDPAENRIHFKPRTPEEERYDPQLEKENSLDRVVTEHSDESRPNFRDRRPIQNEDPSTPRPQINIGAARLRPKPQSEKLVPNTDYDYVESKIIYDNLRSSNINEEESSESETSPEYLESASELEYSTEPESVPEPESASEPEFVIELDSASEPESVLDSESVSFEEDQLESERNSIDASFRNIQSRLKSSPLIPADPENAEIKSRHRKLDSRHRSVEKIQPEIEESRPPPQIRQPNLNIEEEELHSRAAPVPPSFTATDALNTIDEGTIYIAAPGRRSQHHLAYLIDQGWPYNPVFHRPREYRPPPRLYGLFQSPPLATPADDSASSNSSPPPAPQHPDSQNNHNHEYSRWLSRYTGTRNG